MPTQPFIFDALTCHASGGNRSKTQRRIALSTRWLGEDAIWDPRKGADDAIQKVCDVSRLMAGGPARATKCSRSYGAGMNRVTPPYEIVIAFLFETIERR